MDLPEQPRLRPRLAAAPANAQRSLYHLWDPMRLTTSVAQLTGYQLEWVQLFNGQRTLSEIHQMVSRTIGGAEIKIGQFEKLVEDLDRDLFLDSPRFRAICDHPERPCNHLQYYETQPGGLRAVLEDLFNRPGGPGLPGEPKPDEKLLAALVPHMDYGRGGSTYAWAFKEILERTTASLFFIIGTSHYSHHRFTLTRKHFRTPLGVVETDQTVVERLADLYGPGLFDDELMAHWPEHSIELEVAFLQWYFASRRPIRIVPLLVGSFHDSIQQDREPSEQPDIRRMIEALRQLDQEITEPICYLISGDLAHIGPKFQDPQPVHFDQLKESKSRDMQLLDCVSRSDPRGYFQILAAEKDQRRICGFPPTYTFLEAIRPDAGRQLAYDQYVDQASGHESVSFASMVFERQLRPKRNPE